MINASGTFRGKVQETFFSYQVIHYTTMVMVGVVAFVLCEKYWNIKSSDDREAKSTTESEAIQPKTKEDHRGIIEFRPVRRKKK